jgi:hypothetical protein
MKDNRSANEQFESSVVDILAAAFRLAGITYKSAHFLRWKVTDDSIEAIHFDTITKLLRYLEDGNYHLSISEATILGIDREPYGVERIDVEIKREKGLWCEPRAYTDFETFGSEHKTPQDLYARLKKVEEKMPEPLNLIDMFVEIVRRIRDLFS